MEGKWIEHLHKINNGNLSVDNGVEIIKNMIKDEVDYSLKYIKSEWVFSQYQNQSSKRDRSKHILAFVQDEKSVSKFQEAMRASADELTFIKRGEDLQQLLQMLKEKGKEPEHAIFLWGKSQNISESFEDNLEMGLYSIYEFSKVYMAYFEHLKCRIHFFYEDGINTHPEYEAMEGFFKSIYIETNAYCNVVGIDSDSNWYSCIAYEIQTENKHFAVKYKSDKRFIKQYEYMTKSDFQENLVHIREKGVYLITGGIGKLGFKIAKEIAKTKDVKLVLLGSTPLSAEKEQKLNVLRKAGAVVLYVKADLSNYNSVERGISIATKRFGKINGIIHCAGVIKNSLIMNKSREDIEAVIHPKVWGALFLDKAARMEKLDFMVMFSSVASVLGSAGQMDYAYANAFLDSFAQWRNEKVNQKLRYGKSISIQWPYWKEGGMSADEHTLSYLKEKGVKILETLEGIHAFRKLLNSKESSVAVIPSNEKFSLDFLNGIYESVANDKEVQLTDNYISKNEIRKYAENYIKSVFASEIKMEKHKIKLNTPMEKYGFDSMMTISMVRELEKKFGLLPKTLFFEYTDLKGIAEYFVNHHTNILLKMMESQQSVSVEKQSQIRTNSLIREEKSVERNTPESINRKECDIAIIGLAGQYPQADQVDKLWEVLKTGKDCITEIPEDRWNMNEIFDREKGKLGKSYSKWGGFLEDADKFDCFFFNITPAEAELMDPQARLFLQTAWHTVEDAGYSLEELSKKKTGVFVGIMYTDYQIYSATNSANANGPMYNANAASIANRVSYFMNLKGPSIAIDTMCSSSITSILLARKSIMTGECEMAIAGGVNLSVHPYKYQMLSQSHFASEEGRCKSFGEGGSGYVPGEGVGAVLLKPFDLAVKDGDNIYGIIKGGALNHGGKTNGFTVPSPIAQEEVIKEALYDAKISADTITYIETHGTGTSLGDPIEIAGLVKAFQTSIKDSKKYEEFTCPIGSIKSNIGHLESAAGIAALTKVLLQMKHKTLVPSLHSKVLNPNIDFNSIPFKVQQELKEWKNLIRFHSGQKEIIPHRVGISAFGAGGANSHIIIEEHIPKTSRRIQTEKNVLVLSAMDSQRLKEYTANVVDFLEGLHKKELDEDIVRKVKKNIIAVSQFMNDNMELGSIKEASLKELEISNQNIEFFTNLLNQKYDITLESEKLLALDKLDDIADYIANIKRSERDGRKKDPLDLNSLFYTMQTGRKHFDVRVAFITEDIVDLILQLKAYTKGTQTGKLFYEGNAANEINSEGLVADTLFEQREVEKLAELWVNGAEIDWIKLYKEQPLKASLPGYPFLKEKFFPKKVQFVNQSTDQLQKGQESENKADRLERINEGLSDIQIQSRIEKELQHIAAEIIKSSPERLPVTKILTEFGFESVTLAVFVEAVNEKLKSNIEPTIFYEESTIRKLAKYIFVNYRKNVINCFFEDAKAFAAEDETEEILKELANDKGLPDQFSSDIAIIGMSGTLPGSKDLEEFWDNLKKHKDLISVVPKERWNWKDYIQLGTDEEKISTKWGGFVHDVDKFDAKFFGISDGEAEVMDPQQRKLLECVWHTIEDAGYKVSDFSNKKVGLFIGTQFHDYQGLLKDEDILNPNAGLGNEHSILVNRISFYFNFRGPSEPYNTACSSSLVAVHRAVNSILSGETDTAIAGGVSFMLSPMTALSGNSLGALSPDGRCKTLDESANGYVRAEGVASILLKPLDKAVADRDNIYAVIKATGTNHGGKAQSLTAPNAEAQAELIRDVYKKAHVAPEQISYIELHGTGTKLGDPVEINGLKKAFQYLSTDGTSIPDKHCGLGTAKTNIGHLEPVAGIAGLIKIVLSMKYQTLPGILHLKKLNPYIHLDHSPFYIVSKTKTWEKIKDSEGKELPYIGGVSSFGFGGVNAHVAIKEYRKEQLDAEEKEVNLFVLSAKSKDRLIEYAKALNKFIKREIQMADSNVRLFDVLYTLQTGREEMEHRLCFPAKTLQEIIEKTEAFISNKNEKDILYGVSREFGLEELEDMEKRSQEWIASKDWSKLASHWISGGDVNWNAIYKDNQPYRISLPLYPFAPDKYWAELKKQTNKEYQGNNSIPVQLKDKVSFDSVLKDLYEIFKKELQTDVAFDLDTDFEVLAMESIISSVIIQRIREKYGNTISLSAIYNYPTFRTLSTYIVESYNEMRQEGKGKEEKLPDEVLPLNLKGTKLPSFWVHGGPGYGALYATLAEYLGDDYPFYAFQAKGVDGRKIPHTFEEMVEHYKNCITLIQKEGPYIIGGYSFGGLVAYEVARRLHLEGGKIGQLFIFDTLPSTQEALDMFYPYYGGNDNLVTIMMANEFAGARNVGKPLIFEKDIEDIPVPLRVGHVVRLAKERGRKIPMSEDDMYGYINACIRISGHLTELTYSQYRPEYYFGSPVTYFKARCFVSGDNVIYPINEDQDPFVGYDYVGEWAQICKSGFNIVDVSISDHLNLVQQPALKITGNTIRDVIDTLSES
ncbi:UNVERIFIED_CONTAM: polyketide synthase PksL/polyketide synthase PksN [Acetivibrio alkalicellulosi]